MTCVVSGVQAQMLIGWCRGVDIGSWNLWENEGGPIDNARLQKLKCSRAPQLAKTKTQSKTRKDRQESVISCGPLWLLNPVCCVCPVATHHCAKAGGPR